MDTWFDLKAIEFFGRQCVILCQNENGPCPLLAIANVLILQNAIFVHPDKRSIALNELIEIVANAFVEKGASRGHESDVRKDSRQQQLNSVLNIVPNMARGLDLNVHFSGVTAFEFTEEISVFDALDIPLLHGWVLDPQDMITSSVIKTNDSYNHLMFKLVEYKSIQERVTSSAQNSESEPETGANSTPKEKTEIDLIEFNSSLDLTISCGLQTGESWEAVDAKENIESSPYVIIPTGQDTSVPNLSTQSKNVSALNENKLSTAASSTPVVERIHGSSEVLTSSQTAALAADSFFPPAPPAVENRKDLSLEDIELCREGEIIEAFLASTAAQLTYIGLAALHQILQERQLAVFFRNNHFSTIFRNKGKLYLLVTDMGYQNVESVVWERLDDIDGDTEYMDGHFIRTPRHAQTLNYDPPGDAYNQDVSSPQYEYQGTIAQPPQQQQQQHEEQQQQQAHIEPLTMQRSEVDRDLLLAIQLQDEENNRANQRTRSINPLSNSFWTGNSDAPSSHSKAQILQHRALAQASQNKTQRRTSVQGGGAGQSNSNNNRRAASSAPEEESSSPCLIC